MKTRTLSGSVWLLLLLVLTANGQTERSALRGVPATTSVVIEGLSRDAVLAGLSTDQLQTDVELRLRKAGIRISDSATVPSYLYVQITALKSSECGLYAVAVSVGFNRLATLNVGS